MNPPYKPGWDWSKEYLSHARKQFNRLSAPFNSNFLTRGLA